MKIYVITHKKVKVKLPNYYQLLFVGAEGKKDIPLEYLRDDTGKNISKKNCAYCELTGLYWIWQNSNEKIVGLVHYRRFFAKINYLFKFRERYISLKKKNQYRILEEKDFDNYLKEYPIIVKKIETKGRNNRKTFEKLFGENFWRKFREFVFQYTSEYTENFKRVETLDNHLNCNMFVGKKEIIDNYCEWLFTLLNEFDEEHKRESGEYFHNREMGYLSEFLFQVWLEKNNIKYKVLPVVNIEQKEALNGVLTIPEFLKFCISKSLRK